MAFVVQVFDPTRPQRFAVRGLSQDEPPPYSQAIGLECPPYSEVVRSFVEVPLDGHELIGTRLGLLLEQHTTLYLKKGTVYGKSGSSVLQILTDLEFADMSGNVVLTSRGGDKLIVSSEGLELGTVTKTGLINTPYQALRSSSNQPSRLAFEVSTGDNEFTFRDGVGTNLGKCGKGVGNDEKRFGVTFSSPLDLNTKALMLVTSHKIFLALERLDRSHYCTRPASILFLIVVVGMVLWRVLLLTVFS